MDILDEEILNLWKSLNKHQVQYIMTGGFATGLHGFLRTTEDIDIWIKDTLENRKRLRSAFADIEIGDIEGLETIDFLPGWSSISFDSGFELDVMTSMKGFDQSTFDHCFEISPTAIIAEVPVKFLHINQLIEAKKASGRPKDLIDIIELEKIKNNKA